MGVSSLFYVQRSIERCVAARSGNAAVHLEKMAVPLILKFLPDAVELFFGGEKRIDHVRIEVAAPAFPENPVGFLEEKASLYGLFDISASNTSAMATMRPTSGIFVSFRPRG